MVTLCPLDLHFRRMACGCVIGAEGQELSPSNLLYGVDWPVKYRQTTSAKSGKFQHVLEQPHLGGRGIVLTYFASFR